MEQLDTEEVPTKGAPCGRMCSSRLFITIMLSAGMALIYGHKVALHVAIVAMVNHTAVNPNSNHSDSKVDGPFAWDSSVEGYLLSSYFYGYMISELPGGRLSEMCSARWVFFGAVLINIVCHLLSPVMSGVHWGGLLALRILMGVGGGMTFPAAHCMLAYWTPPTERSFLGNITYAGTCLGTVIFMLVSGWIADGLGWQAVFYIEGGVSSIWLVIWAVFTADSPNKQKYISAEERAFIADSLKEETHTEGASVPWLKVFTSKEFWAILIAHTCSNWGWYLFLVELPQYMVRVLKFDMKKNALLSAMPFLVMWIFSMFFGKILQILRAKGIISMTWLRKIGTLFASVVPSLCLVVLIFIDDKNVGVAMLIIAITGIGGMFSGFLANHIDIAPNYAGTLMAITNTVATIPGIVVPILVGMLLKEDPGKGPWTIVFSITIVLYIIEMVVYTIFGSAKVQPWNNM